MLSDLLVGDISKDSTPFREEVSELLAELTERSILLRVDGEFRIQTRAGTEWEQEFRQECTRLARSGIEVAAERVRVLRRAVSEVVGAIKFMHGDAKVPRKLALHIGLEESSADGKSVIVWLRDEWSQRRATVEAAARKAGTDDPVLHVFLPRQNADQLRKNLIAALAAQRVLSRRSSLSSQTSSEDQIEAAENMKSRQSEAEAKRDLAVEEIVSSATVWQGGGSELLQSGWRAKLETGVRKSATRLYPRFGDGDHRGWGIAYKRTKDGSGTPLKVVDWEQKTEEHPVAKEVLRVIGNGNKGKAVYDELKSPPFGWPQDAVDAVLMALLADGFLKADDENGRSVGHDALRRAKIGVARFIPESIRLSAEQKIEIRSLYSDAGMITEPGEEADTAPKYLEELRRMAEEAGGEPPLPQSDLSLLDELACLTGNEQLVEIFNHREALRQAFKEWKKLGKLAKKRKPQWDLACELLRHAAADEELEAELAEVEAELAAVKERRSLLENPDEVAPCLAKLTDGLRRELNRLHSKLTEAVQQAVVRLEQNQVWQQLDADSRSKILHKFELVDPGELQVSTAEEIRSCLVQRSLNGWRDRIDAVASRETQALNEALIQTTKNGEEYVEEYVTVTVRKGPLADEEAVDGWVKEHEDKLLRAVREKKVIVQ